MARNRTRLAKIKAAARRQSSDQSQPLTSDHGPSTVEPSAQASHTLSQAMQSVFGYPVHLIYRDLVKTVLLTTVIIVMIIGIAFWRP